MSTAPGSRVELMSLLEEVEAGRLGPEAAFEQLAHLPYRDLGFARVDTHRELRQGPPEAVLAEGIAALDGTSTGR